MQLFINISFYILPFITGTVCASFIMVIIFRYLSNDLNKFAIIGRSKCDYCNTTLSYFELVPVISWVLNKGKCRYCKHKLSILYPLYELLLGISFAILFITNQPLVVWVFVIFLFVISVIDSKGKSIDSRFIDYPILLLLFYFVIKILANQEYDYLVFFPLIISSCISLLLIVINRIKKSFGIADILIYFSLGLIFSVEHVINIFFLSIILGAIYSIILIILFRKTKKLRIAFLPFIYIATLIAVAFNLCYYLPICPIFK